MNDEEKNQESDSNVWASYSDLFTNVAIIFLVMFVFALIKATISQVQNIQTKIKHNNELKAKLDKRDLEETKERVNKVEKVISEMDQFEDIIDQKVLELNKYVKTLQKNKKIIKDIILSQEKQKSFLNSANEEIEKRNKELALKDSEFKKAEEEIKLLNDKIRLLEKEKNSQITLQKEEMASKTQEMLVLRNKLSQLKREMKNQQLKLKDEIKKKESKILNVENKVQALSKNLVSEKGILVSKIKDYELNLKQIKNEHFQKVKKYEMDIAQLKLLQEGLESKVDSSSMEIKKLNEEIKSLTANLKNEHKYKEKQVSVNQDLRNKLTKVEEELDRAKNNFKKLADERFALAKQRDELAAKHDVLNNSIQDLRNQLKNSNNQNDDLQEKISQLTSKAVATENEVSSWREKYNNQFKELENVKKNLDNSNIRFKNLAQTLDKLKDAVKNELILKLKDKFVENNLDAKINSQTGEVVLLSGEGFNFKKGSSKLSKNAKLILKKIIPVYSEVIMGDVKLLNQISTINLEGHSSPSFGGKYVPPESSNPTAYSYNMRLSAMRASSVASYLMSSEIGNYPHKEKLKSLLQSVGMAYMKPVPQDSLGRTIASDNLDNNNKQNCGPWDCFKSQRVQINFILKDNMEEIKKIINSNGEIK